MTVTYTIVKIIKQKSCFVRSGIFLLCCQISIIFESLGITVVRWGRIFGYIALLYIFLRKWQCLLHFSNYNNDTARKCVQFLKLCKCSRNEQGTALAFTLMKKWPRAADLEDTLYVWTKLVALSHLCLFRTIIPVIHPTSHSTLSYYSLLMLLIIILLLPFPILTTI